MKKRQGFVSNSSTTSFFCEVCEDDRSGWELGPSDVGWFYCENEHIICDACAPEDVETVEDEDYGTVLAEKDCPVCTFAVASIPDLARYFALATAISREEVFEHVKAQNRRRRKLYDREYVAYVAARTGQDPVAVLSTLKERFGTYKAFTAWMSKQEGS